MNEGTGDSKKVVRRVVKKTVVKPVSTPGRAIPSASTAETRPEPTVRRSTTVTQPRPPGSVTAPSAGRRGGIGLSGTGRKVGGAVTGGAGKVGGAVTGGAGKVGGAISEGLGWTRDALLDSFDAVRAWRIPTVEPVKASLITGLICGLVVTGLGAGFLAFFEYVRGVSTGGGLWGGLSVTALGLLCLFMGSWLLRSFGVASPMGTSLLAVMLVFGLLVTFFLGISATDWALVLVPALTTVCYFAAAALFAVIEDDESAE